MFRGETVTYDGPAASYQEMRTVDPCPGKAPELWATSLGGPKATKLAARIADGLILPGFLTSDAVARAVEVVRTERERHDLDPDAFRVMYYMITAHDLDEQYTRAIAHARLATYLVGMPPFAQAYITNNGWDATRMRRLLEHPQFESMGRPTADQAFHRADLIDVSKLVPDAWVQETCAIGSLSHCLDKIREYRDAGADEIGFYGSTPAENAQLINGWRAANAVASG